MTLPLSVSPTRNPRGPSPNLTFIKLSPYNLSISMTKRIRTLRQLCSFPKEFSIHTIRSYRFVAILLARNKHKTLFADVSGVILLIYLNSRKWGEFTRSTSKLITFNVPTAPLTQQKAALFDMDSTLIKYSKNILVRRFLESILIETV